jgi:hypothetical protein
MKHILAIIGIAIWSMSTQAEPPAGFRPSPWFGEYVKERGFPEGFRVLMNAGKDYDPKKPTRLILFATPNGNTIEWTMGRKHTTGQDWHFDIQHVAAQCRRFRELTANENIVFAVTEAEGLSWPAWKKRTKDGPAKIRTIVEAVKGCLPKGEIKVTLACHSGGGSFLFGVIDGGEAIPEFIDRIIFLDANYSYSGPDGHDKKLLAWLKGNDARRLIVIAYDDREIMLNGKKVIGSEGGTLRATGRMRTDFGHSVEFTDTKVGPFNAAHAMNGRIAFYIHPNPENKILHTTLVGEMNGLLRGLTDGGDQSWGSFGGPRAYTKWVHPVPGIPNPPKDTLSGSAFIEKTVKLDRKEREAAILAEILRGNFSPFDDRKFAKVTVKAKGPSGKEHTLEFEAMLDYLAVSASLDFVRMPMNPCTAMQIADAFDCCLPTRKMVNDIHEASAVRLDPKPMTEDRESPYTFLRHQELIEEQRKNRELGRLQQVRKLTSGIKKDVVISNRLGEKPNRVAIYGWHHTHGEPIQPLNVSHVDWYVDYSHGVRLIKRTVTVDGKPIDIRQVLQSPELCGLLSDEGPILFPAY